MGSVAKDDDFCRFKPMAKKGHFIVNRWNAPDKNRFSGLQV